jgi:hypothetical protein
MAGPGSGAADPRPAKESWPQEKKRSPLVIRTDKARDAYDRANQLWRDEKDKCLDVTLRTTQGPMDAFFPKDQVELWGEHHCLQILIHIHNINIAHIGAFIQPIIAKFLNENDVQGMWDYCMSTPEQAFAKREFDIHGKKFLQYALFHVRSGFTPMDLEDFVRQEAARTEAATSQAQTRRDSTVKTGQVAPVLTASSEVHGADDKQSGEPAPTASSSHAAQDTTDELSVTAQTAEKAQDNAASAAATSTELEKPAADGIQKQDAADAGAAVADEAKDDSTGTKQEEQVTIPRRIASQNTTKIKQAQSKAQDIELRGGQQGNRPPYPRRGSRHLPGGPSMAPSRRRGDSYRAVSAPSNRNFSPQYAGQSPQIVQMPHTAVQQAGGYQNVPGYMQQPSMDPSGLVLLPSGLVGPANSSIVHQASTMTAGAGMMLGQPVYVPDPQYGNVNIPPQSFAPQQMQYMIPGQMAMRSGFQPVYDTGHTQGFRPGPVLGSGNIQYRGHPSGIEQFPQEYPRKGTTGSGGAPRESAGQYGRRGTQRRPYDHTSGSFISSGSSRFNNGQEQEPFPPYMEHNKNRRRFSNSYDPRSDRRYSNSFEGRSDLPSQGYGEGYGNRRGSHSGRRNSRASVSNRGGRRFSGALNPRKSFSGETFPRTNSRLRGGLHHEGSEQPDPKMQARRPDSRQAQHKELISSPERRIDDGTLRKIDSDHVYQFEVTLDRPASPPGGRGPPSMSPLPSDKGDGSSPVKGLNKAGKRPMSDRPGSSDKVDVESPQTDRAHKDVGSIDSENNSGASSNDDRSTEASNQGPGHKGKDKANNKKKAKGKANSTSERGESRLSTEIDITSDTGSALNTRNQAPPRKPKESFNQRKEMLMDGTKHAEIASTAERKREESSGSRPASDRQHSSSHTTVAVAVPIVSTVNKKGKSNGAKQARPGSTNSTNTALYTSSTKEVDIAVLGGDTTKADVKHVESTKSTEEEKKSTEPVKSLDRVKSADQVKSVEADKKAKVAEDSGKAKTPVKSSRTAKQAIGLGIQVSANESSPSTDSNVDKSFETATSHIDEIDKSPVVNGDKTEVPSTAETEKPADQEDETSEGVSVEKSSEGSKLAAKQNLTKQKGAKVTESLNPFGIAKAQQEQQRRAAKQLRKKERKSHGKQKDQRKVSTIASMPATPLTEEPQFLVRIRWADRLPKSF